MSFTVMTQKEINELEARITALEKQIKPDLAGQAVTEPEEIIIPDSIQFYNNGSEGDKLGIVFNEGKQALLFFRGVYTVLTPIPDHYEKGSNFKLVKVDPEDREVGHTYFRTDEDDFSSIKYRASYCKYLGNKDYVWILRSGVFVDQIKWDHWYEVVRR